MSMKPALTPEEWGQQYIEIGHGGREFTFYDDCTVEVDSHSGSHVTGYFNTRRHALAALCLHGQPFGFTRSDVEFLRSFGDAQMDIAEGPMIHAIADRIEALLPPEAVE